jgi:hypothetical protein
MVGCGAGFNRQGRSTLNRWEDLISGVDKWLTVKKKAYNYGIQYQNCVLLYGLTCIHIVILQLDLVLMIGEAPRAGALERAGHVAAYLPFFRLTGKGTDQLFMGVVFLDFTSV